MNVWVITTVEDHEPGYLIGVTTSARAAVDLLRERYGAHVSDPHWFVGQQRHHGLVGELPADVDSFKVSRGEGWHPEAWEVTRFELIDDTDAART